MKIARRIILLLLVINGALLYMHYNDEATAIEKEGRAPYMQEIEVIKKENSLQVSHHFSNLKNNTYKVKLPAEGVQITCDDGQCNRFDAEKSEIAEGEETEQTLRYEIVDPSGKENVHQYNHPFVTVVGDPTFTTLHIVDDTKSGGTWISGLPRIGTKQMDSIDYFLYAGIGHITDLLWQKEDTPLAHEGRQVSLFGKGEEALGEQVEMLLNELDTDHMTVVLHGGEHNVESDRFVALPEKEKDRVKSIVFTKGIQTVYGIPLEERRLASVIGSVMSETSLGDKRSREMYKELQSVLSPAQYDQFKHALTDDEIVPLTSKKTDELLSTITDASVHYFRANVAEEKNESLLLFDDREIVVRPTSLLQKIENEQQGQSDATQVEEKVVEGLHRIAHGSQYYYEMKPLLQAFGYDVTWNEQSIYIKNGERDYRISLIDPFYVFEERRFNLREEPYIQINGEYYIDEQSLRRIFKLNVEQSEERVTLQPIV